MEYMMSKIAVVYWSGSGNTESMALLLADGARGADADIAVYTAAPGQVY
jgi:flavodoxin